MIQSKDVRVSKIQTFVIQLSKLYYWHEICFYNVANIKKRKELET